MRKVRLRTVEGGETQRNRSPIIWAVVAIVAVLFITFVGQYTDWLWFLHDARHPEIYLKILTSQAVLWVGGFVITAVPIYFTTQLALKLKVQLPPRDLNAMAAASDILWLSIQKAARPITLIAAITFGILTAGGLSRRYELLWMFQNGGSFGVKDPAFGLDLGFYAFKLPFWELLLGAITGVAVLCAFITAILYSLALSAVRVGGGNFDRNHLRQHASLVGGILLILIGAGQIMSRFSGLTEAGPQFPGPGFAGSQVLTFSIFAGALAVLGGVITIINPLWRRDDKLPFGAVAVWGLVSIGLLGVYPSIVNGAYVQPNRLTVEAPYVRRAIEMTRFSYGIDQPNGRSVEVKNLAVLPEPTPAELAANQGTLDNMRLWDPEVLLRVLDGLQGLRPYYAFPDVDIDRYMIDGEQRMVMVSPRNISVDGLSAGSKNWQTTHLKYTHGFGVAMTKVNEATNSGRPKFVIENVPPVSRMGQDIVQPRIYFSDYANSPEERNGYVMLRTNSKEFDYPAQQEQEYTWTGTRGIPVAPLLNKIALSSKFGDGNLFVSRDLNSQTRLVYRRDIRDRASEIYPMLKFDSDPYMVLNGGRIFWILDGYTTSSRMPYSATIIGPQGRLNYIRNSVKVIQDAYTGDMTAYAVEEQEPILAMIRRTFPGLIKPMSEMPEALRAHLRYGEDFFRQQAEILTQYHVTDATVFLNNEDAWQIPLEIGRGSNAEEIKPYYVQIALPGETKQGFKLIIPFTPLNKQNMSGWMTALNDGEDYGRLVLYKFPKDSQTPGPSQMEAVFNADREVAEINRLLNNNQSRIIFGNMLVIPLGSSILYVKPLFLEATTTGIKPIPELKKVILGLPNNRVVVGDSYAEALGKLFGTSTPPTGQPGEPKPTEPVAGQPVPAADLEAVTQILRLYDEAEAALKSGDIVRYGEIHKQIRESLQRLRR